MPNHPSGAFDLTHPFFEASNRLQRLSSTSGLPYNPPPANFFYKFKARPEEVQAGALKALSFYTDFCQSAAEEQISSDEIQYAWYALRKLNLRPPSDLFGKIEPEDCIEIFDCNGIQVYRSFNFAKYTSYSLEELLTYSWDELYKRDQFVLEMMIKEAELVLSGKVGGPKQLSIPAHICEETLSEARWTAKVRLKYISPLFDPNGNVAGFLATQQIQPIAE